jgi:hypothetical protein
MTSLTMTGPWLDARDWGSTAAEREMEFPCDRHLPEHDDALYRAVDVDAPAPTVFRWLCQLRAAPYSYDWIDNLGRRSPRQLTPGLDDLEVGQLMMGFRLVEFERNHHLTLRVSALGGRLGTFGVTYLVLPAGPQRTRLVVKVLAAYPPSVWIRLPMQTLMPFADLIMMRKQLLTLKALAEGRGPGSVSV